MVDRIWGSLLKFLFKKIKVTFFTSKHSNTMTKQFFFIFQCKNNYFNSYTYTQRLIAVINPKIPKQDINESTIFDKRIKTNEENVRSLQTIRYQKHFSILQQHNSHLQPLFSGVDKFVISTQRSYICPGMSYHRTFFLGFYTSKKSEKGGRYSGDKCQIIGYTIYYCHQDTMYMEKQL